MQKKWGKFTNSSFFEYNINCLTVMKKIALSFITITSFALYTLFLRGNQTLSYQSPNQAEGADSSFTTHTMPMNPTMHKGIYQNGTYTGNSADAYYGYIQVQAIIKNESLSDVVFLDHPRDRATSIRINNYAMPILKSEAIKAQNANVATVSGATDSSIAFRESLALALSKAKN